MNYLEIFRLFFYHYNKFHKKTASSFNVTKRLYQNAYKTPIESGNVHRHKTFAPLRAPIP